MEYIRVLKFYQRRIRLLNVITCGKLKKTPTNLEAEFGIQGENELDN